MPLSEKYSKSFAVVVESAVNRAEIRPLVLPAAHSRAAALQPWSSLSRFSMHHYWQSDAAGQVRACQARTRPDQAAPDCQQERQGRTGYPSFSFNTDSFFIIDDCDGRKAVRPETVNPWRGCAWMKAVNFFVLLIDVSSVNLRGCLAGRTAGQWSRSDGTKSVSVAGQHSTCDRRAAWLESD